MNNEKFPRLENQEKYKKKLLRLPLRRILQGVFLLASVFTCFAQALEEAIPPKPLYQAKLPDGQQCVTEMIYPGMDKAIENMQASGKKINLAPFPLMRTYAVQGKKISVEIKMSDKCIQRKYLQGRFLLEWDSQQGIAYGIATRDNSGEYTMAFPELGWVGPEYFTGKPTGGKYLVYEKKGAYPEKLVISSETLLPLRYESIGVVYRYSYRPISKELAEMPPELQQAWEKISKGFRAR